MPALGQIIFLNITKTKAWPGYLSKIVDVVEFNVLIPVLAWSYSGWNKRKFGIVFVPAENRTNNFPETSEKRFSCSNLHDITVTAWKKRKHSVVLCLPQRSTSEIMRHCTSFYYLQTKGSLGLSPDFIFIYLCSKTRVVSRYVWLVKVNSLLHHMVL